MFLPSHALRVIENQKVLKKYGMATQTWLFPSPAGDMMGTNAHYKQRIHSRSQRGDKFSFARGEAHYSHW